MHNYLVPNKFSLDSPPPSQSVFPLSCAVLAYTPQCFGRVVTAPGLPLSTPPAQQVPKAQSCRAWPVVHLDWWWLTWPALLTSERGWLLCPVRLSERTDAAPCVAHVGEAGGFRARPVVCAAAQGGLRRTLGGPPVLGGPLQTLPGRNY